jgi:hypothetical protein
MVSHHIYKIHKLYNVIKHHNLCSTKTTTKTTIETRSKFQILFTITIAKGKKQHNKCQDLEQYVKRHMGHGNRKKPSLTCPRSHELVLDQKN